MKTWKVTVVNIGKVLETRRFLLLHAAVFQLAFGAKLSFQGFFLFVCFLRRKKVYTKQLPAGEIVNGANFGKKQRAKQLVVTA